MVTRSHILRTLGGAAAVAGFPSIARAASVDVSIGQIGNNSIAFFPIFVAQHEGYFRDAGLNVTVNVFQSGAVVGAAMTSGSIDIGCSVITDVFSLLKAGRPVKVIGSLVNGYYVDIIGSNAFLTAAKVSRSTPLRGRVEALRGKHVGITGPGSGTEALIVYLLTRANMNPTRDIELVNVGTDQAAILGAMQAGRLDAVSFAWPLSMVTEVQKAGQALIMPALGDVPAMQGQVHAIVYARPDVLEKRRDAAVAFVRAIARAEAFIGSNRAGARTLLEQYDKLLTDETVTKLLAAYLPVLPAKPVVSKNAYGRALTFHQLTGYATSAGTSYEDVIDTGIIDAATH
jgi:NitT/TauT family transport system substrate-binding protein